MRQLTITVTESEYPFIRQLLKRQRGVAIAKTQKLPADPAPAETPEQVYARLTPEQQEWVDDLKQSLVDVERHQRGEIELQSFDDFMKELDAEHEAYWGKSASK